MTQEEIERLVREANPVPDMTALEPVDVSLLVLDEQRRTEMPNNEKGPEPERRNITLIGVAAAALLVIAGIVAIGLLNDPPVAAPATTIVTTTDAPATSTTDVTTTSAPVGSMDTVLDIAGRGATTYLILSLPDGWTSIGWAVTKGADYNPFISYWYVENVFGDRCNSAGDVLDPVPGPTVDDLAAAFVEAWGPYATAPVDADLGGYSGKYMVLTVPTTSAECTSVNMNGWMESGAAPVAPGSAGQASRYFLAEGQIEEIWILDVKGFRQVINSSHLPETSAADRAEAQQIVDSMEIKLGVAP